MVIPIEEHWRIQGRAPSPPGPNSFILMQFSAKNMQHVRLAHPLWELVPPQENPRTATKETTSLSQIFKELF